MTETTKISEARLDVLIEWYDYSGETQSALRELKALRQENEWISVQDRMPEKSPIRWRPTPVDVVLRLTNSVECLDYKESEHDGNWYFFKGAWPYEASDITHWRLRPTPPAPRTEETDGK